MISPGGCWRCWSLYSSQVSSGRYSHCVSCDKKKLVCLWLHQHRDRDRRHDPGEKFVRTDFSPGSCRATGKPVEYSGMAIFRIADGKVVEQWQVADQWGLMQQITSSTAQSVTEPLGRR